MSSDQYRSDQNRFDQLLLQIQKNSNDIMQLEQQPEQDTDFTFFDDDKANKQFTSSLSQFINLHKQSKLDSESLDNYIGILKIIELIFIENQRSIKISEYVQFIRGLFRFKSVALYGVQCLLLLPIKFKEILDQIKTTRTEIEQYFKKINIDQYIGGCTFLEEINFELDILHIIITNLQLVENIDLIAALFSLTKLKLNCEYYMKKYPIKQDDYFIKLAINFHNLLKNKIWILSKDLFVQKDQKLMEEIHEQKHCQLLNFLQTVNKIQKDSILIIFTRTKDLDPLSFSSEFVRSQRADIYNNFTIMYTNCKNYQTYFNQIIEYLEDSETIIESYLNKSSEYKEQNQFKLKFLSKISNISYLGFITQNCRNKHFQLFFEQLTEFCQIWRNRNIFAIDNFTKSFKSIHNNSNLTNSSQN